MQVIDRQEARELRLLFRRSQKLRRCGKKLPAFCDADGDKRITVDEWLQCLGVVKGPSSFSFLFCLFNVSKCRFL